jgi:hypothetical protein
MWRFFAGVGSALLLVTAGFFLWTGIAQGDEDPIPAPPEGRAAASAGGGGPARPPSADERTREQRRFDRADRDNDGRVTLEEMTYGRRRNYDRLDTNHDGRLSFEEWAARTLAKFAEVDANRDRALNRAEFAATAPPQRRTAAAAARRANCDCANRTAASARTAASR